MRGRGHQVAHLQSDFYRYKFRKILNWLFVCVFVIFTQIAVILYLIYFAPAQQYYGNTTDGKILLMPRPVS